MPKTAGPKLTRATEDYLEAILALDREKGLARARDIANRLGVGRSAVSNALRALAEAGLVDYEPYRVVTLTEKGRQAATGVQHRHAELKAFVTDVLGLSDVQADDAACRLEHNTDPAVMRRMTDLAAFIRTDHDQDKTPWRDRFIDFCKARDHAARSASGRPHRKKATRGATQSATTLADIPAGGTARVVRVGLAAKIGGQLAEMGLSPEAIVSVVTAPPAGQTVDVRVRGYTLSLPRAQAEGIEVEEL